ncbi:MAG: DUF3857 domain-containing protein [Planctomycetota bacterium]|nr:DUF3857 domain-containing protein [Planctomycetota bacterium]
MIARRRAAGGRPGAARSVAAAIACAAAVLIFHKGSAPSGEGETSEPKAAPLRLPEGPAAGGYQLLLANDFAGAEKVFLDALAAAPSDLKAIEGLRASRMARGMYEKALEADLIGVKAAASDARVRAFAARAMKMLSMVEARDAVEKAFREAMAGAPEASRIYLAGLAAELCLLSNRPAEARKILAGIGYVGRWWLVAGPYGRFLARRSDPMERRFPPESLPPKNLEAKDESGRRIWMARGIEAPFGRLNIEEALLAAGGDAPPEVPLEDGVYYAMANISLPREQDVAIIVESPRETALFLRGMPIHRKPGERRYERPATLIRTRLARGDNPLLVKVRGPVTVSVRVLSADFGLVPDMAFDPPTDETAASHRASAIRGMLFSSEGEGPLASWLRAACADRLGTASGAGSGGGGAGAAETLTPLAGAVDLAEAEWLRLACAEENDPEGMEALARAAAATASRSVHCLELAASLLEEAAERGGHCPSRLPEEARALRERAVATVPGAHEPLLALWRFFSARKLTDRAHEVAASLARAWPESAAARMALAESYAARGMWTLAERELAAAAKAQPACLPRLAAFLNRRSSKAEAWRIYERLRSEGRLGMDEWFRLLMERERFSDAEKLVEEEAAAFPERKYGMDIYRLEIARRKGDAEGTYALAARLYAANPLSRENLVRLVDAALTLKKRDEAVKLLETWLASRRNDLDLRARLNSLRRSGEKWWEKYDVTLKDVDTERFTQARYPRSNYAWLVDFMVTRIYPDYSTESYIHIAKKVINQEGVEELGELPIEAREDDIVFVRTVQPDGRIYVPEHMENFSFAKAASMYRLRPGSIVEYAYLERRQSDELDPELRMGFNFMEIDAPRAVSQWVVIAPKDLPLDIHRVLPEKLSEKVEEDPKAGTVTYVWRNLETEGVKAEPWMPSSQETVPHVWIGSPERPYRATGFLMRNGSCRTPRGARELAAAIVKGCRTDEERFRAIASWVRSNIKEGIAAWSLEDVLAMRAGTTSQMTDLALELGRAAGLKVYPATANRSYGPGRRLPLKSRRREFEPSELLAFNAADRFIVLDRDDAPDLWFRFPGSPPDIYPTEAITFWQAGAPALIFRDRGLMLGFVNGEALGRTTGSHSAVCFLNPDGHAMARGTVVFQGLAAGNLRKVLTDPRTESRIKEGLVRSFWPSAKLEEISAAPMDKPDEPLSIRYVATIEGAASPAGDAMFIAPFPVGSGALRLMGPAGREHDLMIESEISIAESGVEWVAPEGHAWLQVPDDLALATEFGFYFLDFQVRGRSLFCTRAMLIPMQRVPKARHAGFQKFLAGIHAAEKERAGYGPLVAPGFGGLVRDVWSRGFARWGGEEPGAPPEP